MSFEVVKDGSIVATLPVSDREHYTIGRQPDVCDILLDHPSISRQHAALQYGENGEHSSVTHRLPPKHTPLTHMHIHTVVPGEPYLIDLGSAHGTFLNKKRLAARTYTPLMVGGVVKFGASTRHYHVLGPPELQAPEETSEALERSRQESAARQERKRAEKVAAVRKRQRDERGCTWGFDDADADAGADEDDAGAGGRGRGAAGTGAGGDDDDEEAPDMKYRMVKHKRGGFVPQSDEGLTGKDKVDFQRIQGWRLKISNLEDEIGRIKAKEGAAGLTDGQEMQIQRNQERITALRQQIDTVNEDMRDRNDSRAAAFRRQRGKGGGAGPGDDASDEDDFYDRTSMTAAKRARRKQKDGSAGGGVGAGAGAGAGASAPAETVESLEAKLIAVRQRLAEQRKHAEKMLADQRRKLRQEGALGAAAEAAARDGGDELEAFMQTVTQDAVQAAAAGLQSAEKDLLVEEARLVQLLELAQPALPGLVPKANKPPAAPAAAADGPGDGDKAKDKGKSGNKPKGKNRWVASAPSTSKAVTKAAAAANAAAAAEQEAAELEAAFGGGRRTIGPRAGLGSAGAAAPTALGSSRVANAAVAAALAKKKRKQAGATLTPGLNIRKK